MEFKGTEGPWIFDQDGVTSNAKNITGDIICDSPKYAVRSNENWNANAKLIAAAPELFEALKELVDVKEIKDSQGKSDEYLARKDTAWIKANRAISKAI